MPKKIIITEEQLKAVMPAIQNSIQYVIDPEQVLIVKSFLDNNYEPYRYNTIGADGLQHGIDVVKVINSDEKNPILKYKEDLLEILISTYKNMFTDKVQRRKFLGQVMEDWYNNKIGLYGSLSVNHL